MRSGLLHRIRLWAHLFVAGEAGAKLEPRLYRSLCLVAAVMTLSVITPLNLVTHLSIWLDLAVLLFGLGSVALYYAARRGFSSPALFFAMLVALLNVAWFTNGGAEGSIVDYQFAAVAYAMIFFRGWRRWTLLALFVANSVGLLVVERYFPASVIPFGTPDDRVIDLATGVVTGAVACTVMLWVVLTAYDVERRKEAELSRKLQELLDLNRIRTAELEDTLAEVSTLRGLLPICGSCKKVRDDAGLWTQVEQYVSRHSLAEFSHSICPSCLVRLYPEDADAVMRQMTDGR